jgi:hypothetical protein
MIGDRFLYILTGSAVAVTLFLALGALVRAGQPSADQLALSAAQRPVIEVADFAPGDVEIRMFDGLPIVIWRRNAADMELAALQDDPDLWWVSHSQVLGLPNPVFASDENLTIGGEWFIALVWIPVGFQTAAHARRGDFDGFFDMHYANHYDLSGRLRKGYGGPNMTIVRAELSEDGRTIQLDLRRLPPARY